MLLAFLLIPLYKHTNTIKHNSLTLNMSHCGILHRLHLYVSCTSTITNVHAIKPQPHQLFFQHPQTYALSQMAVTVTLETSRRSILEKCESALSLVGTLDVTKWLSARRLRRAIDFFQDSKQNLTLNFCLQCIYHAYSHLKMSINGTKPDKLHIFNQKE